MALPSLFLTVYLTSGAVSDLRRHWHDGFRVVAWVGLGKVLCVMGLAVLVIVAGVILMLTPEPSIPRVEGASRAVAGVFFMIDGLILLLAVMFVFERAYAVPHARPNGRQYSQDRQGVDERIQ